MSFYVTLPSNSSMEYFIDNKLSNFTTKLPIPLKFNTPYEVALVEITFTENWISSLGTLHFTSPDRTLSVPITHKDGTSIQQSLFFLANAFNIGFKTNFPNVNNPPEILITNDSIKFICDENEFFEIDGVLQKYLHTDKISKTSTPLFINKFLMSHYEIHSLYVYTDIIKWQYVGDTMAPLLRNVQVTNNHNHVTTITYDTPHYNALSSTYIDTINISIKDDAGDNIKFLSGKNIVKLHFRPIRYGF